MTTLFLPSLASLPPAELTARLYSLRAQERSLLVEFLAYLGELDRRRLHLELGFPSTFAFCTDHLGLSKGSTFRRLTAARLLVRFPMVAEYLSDGRLGLTTLVELRDVLGEDGLAQTLDRAAGKTEEEVKALAAALKPQPAPPDLVRRLPGPPAPQPELPLVLIAVDGAGSGPEPLRPTPAPKPARIEPISEELRVLRMTVGRAFVDDLDKVRDALSHVVADRRLESVLHECIRRTLRECSRRRGGGASGAAGREAEPIRSGDGARRRPAPRRRALRLHRLPRTSLRIDVPARVSPPRAVRQGRMLDGGQPVASVPRAQWARGRKRVWGGPHGRPDRAIAACRRRSPERTERRWLTVNPHRADPAPTRSFGPLAPFASLAPRTPAAGLAFSPRPPAFTGPMMLPSTLRIAPGQRLRRDVPDAFQAGAARRRATAILTLASAQTGLPRFFMTSGIAGCRLPVAASGDA